MKELQPDMKDVGKSFIQEQRFYRTETHLNALLNKNIQSCLLIEDTLLLVGPSQISVRWTAVFNVFPFSLRM